MTRITSVKERRQENNSSVITIKVKVRIEEQISTFLMISNVQPQEEKMRLARRDRGKKQGEAI